jgi:DNA-binding HxlR family transcriptional regulator
MDLVGERWAVLVLRELAFGPKRFTDLRAGLPSASPNVLSQRLRELDATGIIRRRRLAPPAGSWVYELTDWGKRIEPALRELGRWAASSPTFPDEGHMSTDAMAMSMDTMFQASAASGFEATFALRLGEADYRLEVSAGALQITRAESGEATARIETDPGTWVGLIYQGKTIGDAERAGLLRIEGDRKAVERLTTLFELPERAELEPASA